MFRKLLFQLKDKVATTVCLMLLTLPASTNYKLDGFGFGAGGETTGASGNYKGEYVLGETSSTALTGTNFNAWPGLLYTQFANTPTAPTVTNASNYYNKLNVVVNTASNPSNTTYAIAISDDNFSTTQYVQSDNTVGATLGIEDWQAYADWGGASGEFVIGLDPGTTYYFKVKAERGDYTEGPWGPTASVATANSTLSFDIDVSSSDSESAAPYSLSLGTLTPGSVTTASERIWVDLSTNATGGGQVFILGDSAGLYSTAVSHTISSVTGDLSALSEGFGIRSGSVAETSGGPFAPVSPFNGTSDTVGQISTVFQELFNSSSSPITGGRGSALIKAKIKNITPAANDYAETLTLVAVGTF